MSEQSELHNDIANRFVMTVIGPAIKGGASYADLMVIFETMQVAMMETLARHYKLAPDVASGLCEASLDRAIERFSAIRGRTN